MPTLKSVLIFAFASIAFGVNAHLYTEQAGVLVWTREADDPWYVDCYYYAPVRMYTLRKPVQFGCTPYATDA